MKKPKKTVDGEAICEKNLKKNCVCFPSNYEEQLKKKANIGEKVRKKGRDGKKKR